MKIIFHITEWHTHTYFLKLADLINDIDKPRLDWGFLGDSDMTEWLTLSGWSGGKKGNTNYQYQITRIRKKRKYKLPEWEMTFPHILQILKEK